MPMENMVHMFGGTKKKSTLVDERVILYPNFIITHSTIASQEKMKVLQDRRYWISSARFS